MGSKRDAVDLNAWMNRLALRTLENIESLSDDPDRRIHRLRTDMKKLRSAAKLVRTQVREDIFETVAGEARFLKNAFAADRDAHVIERTIGRLLGGEAVRRHCENVARGQSRTAAPPPEFHEIVESAERLESAIRLFAGDRIRLSGLKAEFRKTLVRFGAAREEAAASPDSEPWHRWRMRAKDVWYQAMMLRPSSKRAVRSRVPAKKISRVLGREHDVSMVLERIKSFSPDECDLLVREQLRLREIALLLSKKIGIPG